MTITDEPVSTPIKYYKRMNFPNPSWNSLSRNLLLLGVYLCAAILVRADVEYKVGEGEAYQTVQSAIDALPKVLDQTHIIRIKSGTYAPFSLSQIRTSSVSQLIMSGGGIL